ncbi:MAG: histidine phosphatase family protein [Anaerorhabdus sp.]|uniref:histidine phosphatase family protein n=1 Tax=Anaerorhabdus sp. TaxID=1872524 RepID=UPI003A8B6A5F
MVTTIYFVRHATSDHTNRDERTRGLTEKGLQDCKLVTEYLNDKDIDFLFSSPYHRSVLTIQDFANKSNLDIQCIEDFRERKVDSGWIENFEEFARKQWSNFTYKLNDGEPLCEVQKRNIHTLQKLLIDYKDKTFVIGTHGTALSTIINYYQSTFQFDDFWNIVDVMPWIVKMTFDNEICLSIESINLFTHKNDTLK